jgi:hypothetical protein
MKKISIILITIVLFFSKINAQITISQSDMPSNGDTIRYSNASLSSLSFTPNLTGGSYTWNFNTLSKTSQDIYEYKSSTSTAYLLYFFGKIGLKTDDISISSFSLTNIYSFYTKNSSLFKTEGQGYSYNSIPLANNYIDDDEIYQFPLNFGDKDSSTFYFNYNLSAITSSLNYAQAGYRINEVDGYGSIVTPYSTYTNVLRVKTTLVSHDSIKILSFPINTTRKTITYKWLSNTEKIPVLEISGTLLGSSYTINSIKYRDKVQITSGIFESDKALVGATVYPNPFSDFLSLKSENINLEYKIVDINGREILSGSFSNLENKNTELLPKGVYFVTISNIESNKSQSFKVIKD